MKCPFSFSNPTIRGCGVDCDPDCALRLLVKTIEDGEEKPAGFTCAFAAMSSDKPENVRFYGIAEPIWGDRDQKED